MLTLNYILFTVITLMAVPVFILFLQAGLAFFYKKNQITLAYDQQPSVVILMPAHNESLVIEKSIQAIKPQLGFDDQLIIIADNCTDDTAEIATRLGVQVVERFDQDKRGKGYALDFGLKSINQSTPPDVVIVVDADCIVAPKAIERLAKHCFVKQRPVQALYLMDSQPSPTIKDRIATFAWVVKNKVRPLGFSLIGLPCQLMGTGMAFLWNDINNVNLASGHIVEDMKLGADLARFGKAPLFLLGAEVSSIFPPNEEGVKTQRARWEHGHLSVIVSEAPKLFFEAVKNKNLQLFGMACDLLIPPLAMLTLICVGIVISSLIFGSKLVIMLALSLLLGLMSAIFLAWFKFGRSIISFKQLCYAPIYAIRKIPLYIQFFLNRQVEWVRSKRD